MAKKKRTDNPVASEQDVPRIKKATGKYTVPLETVPTFYCDNTAARSSVFGFRLVFGLAADAPLDDSSDVIPIKPQAILHMSPTHAKSLLRLLQIQIKAYEDKFKITLPDG